MYVMFNITRRKHIFFGFSKLALPFTLCHIGIYYVSFYVEGNKEGVVSERRLTEFKDQITNGCIYTVENFSLVPQPEMFSLFPHNAPCWRLELSRTLYFQVDKQIYLSSHVCLTCSYYFLYPTYVYWTNR